MCVGREGGEGWGHFRLNNRTRRARYEELAAPYTHVTPHTPWTHTRHLQTHTTHTPPQSLHTRHLHTHTHTTHHHTLARHHNPCTHTHTRHLHTHTLSQVCIRTKNVHRSKLFQLISRALSQFVFVLNCKQASLKYGQVMRFESLLPY